MPFLISTAELDPSGIIAFAETLKRSILQDGRCPTYLVFKDHSHISEMMSPNTADDSVTSPILNGSRASNGVVYFLTQVSVDFAAGLFAPTAPDMSFSTESVRPSAESVAFDVPKTCPFTFMTVVQWRGSVCVIAIV